MFDQIKSFERVFWLSNLMELFERMAWYGLFMLMGLYLTGSTETGALGFSQSQKGMLMGVSVALLYLLPVITGAISDKFGYKKSLIVAYSILITGYLLLGTVRTFPLVFIAFIWTSIGASIFKPLISATIAKKTNTENSSLGFGIFYLMVNIGAFIGPLISSKLRIHNWYLVFVVSALAISINLFLTIFFYKEPIIEKNTESIKKTLRTVFRNISVTLTNFKFVILLLLITGFWTMYNQLYYTLPNFIDQWMDTSLLYDNLYQLWPKLAQSIGTASHTIAPEMITNIDAFYIIAFQLIVSLAVSKFNPLKSMAFGFLMSSVGMSLSFITQDATWLIFTLFIFAVGEMASSPKITEYIGRMAPKDKVALYLGCSFLPLSAGNLLAGILSGSIYEKYADKLNLTKIELTSRHIEIPTINSNFTNSDFYNYAADKLNMSQSELTGFLWKHYHPANIWIIIFSIGLTSVLGLLVFNKVISKSKNGL